MPRDELSSVASAELWAETYDRVATLVREHRSTLVFVNTRRLVERAAHALQARLGEEAVAAHHGSLSRERRRRAEERLKSGELRVAVATSSLELGIDVGQVDLVIQLGSPGALTSAGRSSAPEPDPRSAPPSRASTKGAANAPARGVGAAEGPSSSLPRVADHRRQDHL